MKSIGEILWYTIIDETTGYPFQVVVRWENQDLPLYHGQSVSDAIHKKSQLN